MVKVKNLIIAAGGILLRGVDEVLLIHRPRYDDWSFPKGKLDSGESPLETALREVREETGFEVTPAEFAGAVGYLVQNVPKTVLYWVMTSGKQGEIEDRDEVSELVWVSAGDALKKLTYELEKEMLTKVLSGRQRGPS